MLLFYSSIVLFALSALLFVLVARQRKQAGLPPSRIIYSDAGQWGKVEKPLYHEQLHLAGKPDYVVREGKQMIPVEVKSRQAPAIPFEGHIYQLAAYCLLVEHAYGIRPDHGILHYSNRSYAVDFTPGLERSLQAIVEEMQIQSTHSDVNRSHDDAKRCRHCGYRPICDQALRI
jgi:CRISPR-associated exonuclease Cas4